MREVVPPPVWSALRLAGLAVTVVLVAALFVDPPLGLFLFWGLFVPVLPLVFFVAPGLWRNVCPMATLNQLPRVTGFTRGITMPKWFREYGYLIGALLFLTIVPARKIVFEGSAPALAALIVLALAAALVGGVLLRGKSGWCSTLCPLLPVQRLYGQTPFLTVRNAHCRPCVGCVKNCYDFNPAAAYMADLYDTDEHRSGYRKLFAAAFPGLIVGFYALGGPPALSPLEMYFRLGAVVLLSIGSFYVLTVLLRVTATRITTLYGAAALNLYYWFALPELAARFGDMLGVGIPPTVTWAGQATIAALTAVWVARTYRKEAPFVAHTLAPKPAHLPSSEALARLRA